MQLNWKRVAIDVGIIFILNAIGSLIFAGLVSVAGTLISFYWVGLLANLIFMGGGFAYVAYKVRGVRWPHLFAVALVLWGINILWPLFGLATFSAWLLSIFRVVVPMVIGGGIATVLENLRLR